MSYVVTKWFGVFLHDGKRVTKYILFSKDDMPYKLERIMRGEILEEEKKIVEEEKKVFTYDKRLSPIAKYVEDSEFGCIEIDARDYGFDEKTLQELALELAKKRVDEELSRRDLQVIQLIKNYDEMISILNIIVE
ncbi:MAG TPA: hypothetical protein ENG74_02615, partial [Thermoplasmatales archaeon]|nr:hypothetical protein [Thermoplasmatales archaeon]